MYYEGGELTSDEIDELIKYFDDTYKLDRE